MTEERADELKWAVHYRVDKYDGPDADARAFADVHALADADDVIEGDGNLLTTAGLARITSLITAAGGQGVTATSARIGVGDSTTAAAVGDTDLGAGAGATHRQFEIMSGGKPTTSNGVITLQAVFPTGEANFAWQEWGVDVGTPTVAAGTTVAALLLNHKVTSLGTKTSASAWTFTVTITLA